MSDDPIGVAVADHLVLRPGAGLYVTETGYDVGYKDYTIVFTIGNPTLSIRNHETGVAVNPNWGANKQVFLLTSGALPTGYTRSHCGMVRTTYYVKNPSGTTIQLSLTPGGAAITPTGSQSGIHVIVTDAQTAYKISERAISKYYPRLCCCFYQNPDVDKYSLYTLLDDKNGDLYGMCEGITKVPRRHFYSLRNLMFLTKDPGIPFVPSPIAFTLALSGSAPGSNLQYIAMGRRDGSYQFLVWNEVDSYDRNTLQDINPAAISANLTVTSPAFSSCQIFDPTVLDAEVPNTKRDTPTSTPSITNLATSGLVLSVFDKVQIVKLIA